MSNHLKNQTSPYLLQHSENPVDWYPWCEEAFNRAKDEDKPIFLSIGYSTCHWCHVMEKESFEDAQTAKILNDNFISVKVDREERPDIDSVYMSVCQAFTGSGGWPTSIFMTAERKPFFAGTYFPIETKYGMPGFKDLLNIIIDKWQNDKSEIINSADTIVNNIQMFSNKETQSNSENLVESAFVQFKENFDKEHGGFGFKPKFPTPHNLIFLMLYSSINNNKSALEMVTKTLNQMRKGGIFDHIGYGFSRYSTDQYFLAPHFEKMLYDNALLIIAYLAAYSITQDEFYIDTCKKTAEYIIREMISDKGGFYSAQDADSEGVEGKFYVFSYQEIIDILGNEKGTRFADVFDITQSGNFEGKNIPNLLKSNEINDDFSEEFKKLYDYRSKRTKLHLDDKVLTSWNSLMITALSMLYRITKDSKYLDKAMNAQKFIEKNLCDNKSLFTSWCRGEHSKKGFLEDYAFYITSLIELYNSTLDKEYLNKAEIFCKEAIIVFSDEKNGGFYLCPKDSNELFINPKETYDGAIPSGNSAMTYNIVRLYQITKKKEYEELAKLHLNFMNLQAQDYPSSYCLYLTALLINEKPPQSITVVLKDNADLDAIKRQLPFFANICVLESPNENYSLLNDKTTYYVCKNNMCLAPSNSI